MNKFTALTAAINYIGMNLSRLCFFEKVLTKGSRCDIMESKKTFS